MKTKKGCSPGTTGSGQEAILVDAKTAATNLGIGLRTFRAMDAAGKIPEPVRLSRGCVRWRVQELIDWIEVGCPCRQDWEVYKQSIKSYR